MVKGWIKAGKASWRCLRVMTQYHGSHSRNHTVYQCIKYTLSSSMIPGMHQSDLQCTEGAFCDTCQCAVLTACLTSLEAVFCVTVSTVSRLLDISSSQIHNICQCLREQRCSLRLAQNAQIVLVSYLLTASLQLFCCFHGHLRY